MNEQEYKISVLGIFSQAAEALGNNKAYYSKVLLLPTLFLVGSSLLSYGLTQFFPEATSVIAWVSFPILWLSYGIFSVACHRLILLSGHEPLIPYSLHLSRREWLFCLYLIIIAVITYLLLLLVFMPLQLLVLMPLLQFYSLLSFADWMPLVSFTLGLLNTYFLGRFCLIFPSIAMDERMSLKQSWIVTRGNSLRILCIIGLVPLFWIVLSMVSGNGEEVSVMTYLTDTLLFLLQPIILAFQVFLVSFVYKNIKEKWVASASNS